MPAEEIEALLVEAGWAKSVDRQGETLPFARQEGQYWIVNGRPNGVDDHVGVAGPGAEFMAPIPLAYALVERAKGLQRAYAEQVEATAIAVVTPPVVEAEPEPKPEPPPPEPDPRDEELAALRARVAELEAVAPEPPPQLLPESAKAWADTDAEAALTPNDLLEAMRADLAATEDVVRKLTKTGRKKFTELLNVELTELLQERGGPRENLKRENEIEGLLDLFARVGEM